MAFDAEKLASLERVDLSRKGAVDEAIVPLIGHINSLETCYTTSSCSGRIAIYCQDPKNLKKGCRWILVSHVPLKALEIWSLLNAPGLPPDGYVFFKFEPFILHMMCKSLETAQGMLQVAVSCGFRNSGITIGKRDRVMLAVRSTHSLEAPVACGGKVLVNLDYLSHLVELANAKMAENLQRVDRFMQQLTAPQEVQTRCPEKCGKADKRGLKQPKTFPATKQETLKTAVPDAYLLLSDDILPDLFS